MYIDFLILENNNRFSKYRQTVWYKTKFGSQNLATNFGNHL